MQKQEKQCEQGEKQYECMMKSFKKMDRQCQKVMAKTYKAMMPMGMACYQLMQICPFSMDKKDSMQEFQACVGKNMHRLPKSCKDLMRSMTAKQSGGKANFDKILEEGKKKKSAGKNVQVQQK